jgi:hypothetical protein
MTPKKIIVALALLLTATSLTLAQNYHRPGPYFGNDYGPDSTVAQATQDGGAGKES